MKIIHASPDLGSKLSEEQVIDFLCNSRLNLQLGTIDDKGEPNIHPIWYIFENNKLVAMTDKTSRKFQNLKNSNKVYFCIDDEKNPYKGIRGKATTKVQENIEHNLPVAEKIITKYMGTLDHEVSQFLLNWIKSGFSVILEINPEYYSTWDHISGLTG